MQEDKTTGYSVRSYAGPVKRYCQTMDLKNDPQLIAQYRERHSQSQVWPEILAGIRQCGILEMEIYILNTRLFMIVETPLDFDWELAMKKMASLPRQDEWEKYMAIFQNCSSDATSDEKWQMMERMFRLYE